MGHLLMKDGSEAVRVEITGVLSGSLVEELRCIWEGCQSSQFWRQFVVDISGLTGYDTDGHALLHELNKHGATFGAGTPLSLSFLEDISSGSTRLAIAALSRRPAERSTSPRPRHKAGLGSIEAATARAR